MKSLHSLLACVLAAFTLNSFAAELRVITHNSFSLPKSLIAEFEQQHQAKLSIIKAGDAGEMLNKLILSRANPIADVVFGLDNSLITKALQANILAVPPAGLGQNNRVLLPGAVSVDYGYVALNYDKAWFAKQRLPLPKSLQDLTLPAYKNLLVVQNPATSSPGLGFMLATIQQLGEEPAWAFWAKLRDNGVKVSKGWSEAYYTDFSHNGGARPLVVSYVSSPAAEVFYSKTKLNDAPTGNLLLPGGVFRQVEGAALIKGGQQSALATKFIAFLLSESVQKSLPTSMWMYPVRPDTPLDTVYRFAIQPSNHATPDSASIAKHSQRWVKRWTQIVLKTAAK